MSRGTQETRLALLEELARELRKSAGLGASFFRAASARSGMTITDMEVVDLLGQTDGSTAGQLADQTGLTTGAITGMLNRLEEAGIVQRERDPNDGRKVIVRLIKGKGDNTTLDASFASIGAAWEELAAQYEDEQLATLVGFLAKSNELTRREIARLRETPAGENDGVSAPLGEIESGRLIIPSGIAKLILRADSSMSELFQARFEGTPPDVKSKEGVVTIRYPRRLWGLTGGDYGKVNITLNASIPWGITIRGGASDITAELGNLNLSGVEISGGMSMIRLNLPAPTGVVPVRISGGAASVTIRRPVGAPAQVHLQGWVSTFVFDEQRFSAIGNDVRLKSVNYSEDLPCYDIEVNSSASTVTITTDE